MLVPCRAVIVASLFYQGSIELSSGAEFTVTLDEDHSTCPSSWVDPCLNNAGGCKNEFSECKAVGCSSEVVCAKCVGSVDKDGNCIDDSSDSDNNNLLYAFAAGGLAVVAISGAVYAKKKKPQPTEAPVEP